MAADAGGEVVDVEEALEQLGVLDLVLQLVEDRDLPVHEGLEPPREIDEDLELLLAARLTGQLGGLDDGGDGALVRTGEVGGEQLEVVGVRRMARRAPCAGPAPRRGGASPRARAGRPRRARCCGAGRRCGR